MASCDDFKKMAYQRLKAGNLLLTADGSYADVAIDCFGLAIEFALKAAVCKSLSLKSYPDTGRGELSQFFRTHQYDTLLILSGLSQQVFDKRKRIFKNWSAATPFWNASAKYDPVGSKTKAEADRMYKALTDGDDGVINWIGKKIKW